jgi:DNA-binding Lrp family transcriptional regulator
LPVLLQKSDLQIVEALERYGPRNITDIARRLEVPAETLRKRLKRLRSTLFFRTSVNIYHTNLGLRKAVVFAEATPGYEDLLLNCLKANDFWIFVSRCYGTFEGCIGIFTIPKNHVGEFEQFIEAVRKSAVAKNTEIFWSTCFQSVSLKCDWFDRESHTWDFRWDEWLDEIEHEDTDLPYILVEPEDFPIRGDKIDLLILKELEKDATANFTELGAKLSISPQRVGYRYQRHLVERGLIEDFRVSAIHFDRAMSDFHFFILEFDSHEKFAKFASSLLDKPFARALGKILGENALYAYLYLPKSEFRKFLTALARLVRSGFIESYQYAIQDTQASWRQTIPYEYFENGTWIYDHGSHQEKLEQLIQATICA